MNYKYSLLAWLIKIIAAHEVMKLQYHVQLYV